MQKNTPSPETRILIALIWCIGWSTNPHQNNKEQLHQARQAILSGKPQHIPTVLQPLYSQVQTLLDLRHPNDFQELKTQHPALWAQSTSIGLVYGGATKIKGYVFESAKLSDIRGASALLDQINLIDLPAFFEQIEITAKQSPSAKHTTQAEKALNWLNDERNFPGLADALIPELIIYSTGGNILAFCPTAYVDMLANAIEKRYSEETLTANACAVGRAYRPLEIKLGVLQDDIAKTPWLDWYQNNATHFLVEAYYGKAKGKSNPALAQQFQQRKNFSEIVGKLTADFQQRRNGNSVPDSKRPSRCYPPMFETHPYLCRDGSEKRSVLRKVDQFPGQPQFSEAQARKLHIGRLAKRDGLNKSWFEPFNRSLHNNAPWPSASSDKREDGISSWVAKFEDFLEDLPNELRNRYYSRFDPRKTQKKVKEARYLSEIGHASNPGKGYVAYIYADGNNMGGYIQNKIDSPEAYRRFSKDIFCATENSVYLALAQHLHPVQVPGDPDDETKRQKDAPIHPFEIITIGGDDVLLIVPASAALGIAQTLGEQFENILLNDPSLPGELKSKVQGDYSETSLPEGDRDTIHRYRPNQAPTTRCQLSTSCGVLITQDKTPIYYAQSLTNQLLKSAKDQAKSLKKSGYFGGTVDFLVLKNVTMISSDVKAFRKEGLTIERHHGPPNKPIKKNKKPDQILKLYATPYTLYELRGLLDTLHALKTSKYPRSQLYQVRSLLEQGKRTAMLNYHYFRARLSKRGKQGQPSQQALLIERFEQAWCTAKSNSGTLSPWISILRKPEPQTPPTQPEEPPIPTYETIWRELVDLYPFVPETNGSPPNGSPTDEDATAQHNAVGRNPS